jgi:hypothetical protein
MNPLHMFSLEWPTIIYFQLENCATRARQSLQEPSVIFYDLQEFQILSRARDLDTRLLGINLRKENQQSQHAVANNVCEISNAGALVNNLHKALFIPTKSALLQAVKNRHIITWPRLTEKVINKYLKLTPATAMGRMN